MDTLNQYREIISKILQAEAGPYAMPELEDVFIRNEQGDRFLLVRTGWFKNTDYHSLIQDIALLENGFVVIYADNTDEELAEELVEAGIPAASIIEAYDPDQQQRLQQAVAGAAEYRQAA